MMKFLLETKHLKISQIEIAGDLIEVVAGAVAVFSTYVGHFSNAARSLSSGSRSAL